MMRTLSALPAALAAVMMIAAPALGQECPAPPADDPIDFGPTESLTIVTEDDRHSLDVEIADTAAERSRGLMYRPEIPPDYGMLFQYPAPERVSFYMRNTCASLDILYIRPDGQIESIVRHAIPLSERSLPSIGPVTGVIELAAGRAEELGIAPGARVEHPFFETADAESTDEEPTSEEEHSDGE